MKDPNQWLSDMDDMMKQRQQSQTRASGCRRTLTREEALTLVCRRLTRLLIVIAAIDVYLLLKVIGV